MPSVYCHACNTHSSVDDGEQLSCPSCGDSFVEVLQAPSASRRNGNHSGRRRRFHFVPGPGLPAEIDISAILSEVNSSSDAPDTEDFSEMILRMLRGAWNDDLSVLADRLMQEYEPRDNPASLSVRKNLIKLKVRPAGANGEPDDHEAFACAGEPCPICHEEFETEDCVAELPCSHVSIELVWNNYR
jgi:hypothetical protein